VQYDEEHKLPNAIKAAGYDIKDVKGVVFGHLHLDHAGGLEHFVGTDVPSKSIRQLDAAPVAQH
jgi:glyoxylase-like metal-dependent hydrolase (beta-lactamase superfamily II)